MRIKHGRPLPLPRSPRLLTLASDERLVQHVRGGNEAAFEALYDRHHGPLLAFCTHLLQDRAEAEDALQQTFASAYVELREGRREIHLKPWLFTIARNKCLTILRRRRSHAQPIEPSAAELEHDVGTRAQLRELLGDIRRLPLDQRAALVLAEMRGLSHREIGAVLDRPHEQVKALIFQARTHLLDYRDARATPCAKIRREVASRRPGAPTRRVRLHLATCRECAAYREAVRRRRAAVIALIPATPSAALKAKTLAGAGVSSSSGGLVGGLTLLKAGALAVAGAVAVFATGAVIPGPPPRAKAAAVTPPAGVRPAAPRKHKASHRRRARRHAHAAGARAKRPGRFVAARQPSRPHPARPGTRPWPPRAVRLPGGTWTAPRPPSAPHASAPSAPPPTRSDPPADGQPERAHSPRGLGPPPRATAPPCGVTPSRACEAPVGHHPH